MPRATTVITFDCEALLGLVAVALAVGTEPALAGIMTDPPTFLTFRSVAGLCLVSMLPAAITEPALTRMEPTAVLALSDSAILLNVPLSTALFAVHSGARLEDVAILPAVDTILSLCRLDHLNLSMNYFSSHCERNAIFLFVRK